MSDLEKTARLFRQHRRRWISALTLARVGGLLAWRTRVSECRTRLGMDIVNSQEHVNGLTRSYYTYRGKLGS